MTRADEEGTVAGTIDLMMDAMIASVSTVAVTVCSEYVPGGTHVSALQHATPNGARAAGDHTTVVGRISCAYAHVSVGR